MMNFLKLSILIIFLFVSTNILAQEQESALMERMIEEKFLIRTDFTEAVSTGDADTVRAMFNAGYNVRSASARLGLVVASQMGYVEVVRAMLLAGVDQYFSNGEILNSLFLSVVNWEIELLSSMNQEVTVGDVLGQVFAPPFLAEGIRGEAKSWIALRKAIEHGHTEVVHLLLLDGMQTTLLSNSLSSLITIAKESGHNDIVEILDTLCSYICF